jgi:Major Facilitator Superfamily
MASRSREWLCTKQWELGRCCTGLRKENQVQLESSMSMRGLIPVSLRVLPKDAVVLFVTRFTRLFAYGALSVILVFYLVSLGFTEAQVGLLLTLTLAGDIAISLLLTTQADRIGRRRMLIVGAILMAGAGIAFASTKNLLFLIVAGTIGVISPSGHEVGPFLSIEQAALSHVVPARSRGGCAEGVPLYLRQLPYKCSPSPACRPRRKSICPRRQPVECPQEIFSVLTVPA